MNEYIQNKFNSYGTLITVASLILIVVYASGAYDGWDALISLMGLWFGGYYLWQKAQFDWPSQFLASLITSCSLVLLCKSGETIWFHYQGVELVQKYEPLGCPTATGGISGLLVVAVVSAIILTMVLGKPNA